MYGLIDAGDSVCDLLCVSGEFLAEGEGCGVHEMGPADFDDVVEGLGFLGESVAEFCKRG